jgi:GH25 family lysozyme M1 (1,4-beta-N-acetylmuramidase)
VTEVQLLDLYGKYNSVKDFNAVKKTGITGVHIKLADGADTRDDYGYCGRAHAAGLLVGGYGFSQNGDPRLHAATLLNQITKYRAIELSPPLDMEDNPMLPNGKKDPRDIPQNQKVAYAVAYLTRLREAGFRPTLYANNADMKLLRAPVLAAIPDCWIWVARYGANPTVNHDLWQYTSTGTVPGITGVVDRSKGALPTPHLSESSGSAIIPGNPTSEEEDTMQPIDLPTSPDTSYVTKLWDGRKAVLNFCTQGDPDTEPAFIGEIGLWGPQGGTGGGERIGGWVAPNRVDVNQPGQWNIPAGTTRVFFGYSSHQPCQYQIVAI